MFCEGGRRQHVALAQHRGGGCVVPSARPCFLHSPTSSSADTRLSPGHIFSCLSPELLRSCVLPGCALTAPPSPLSTKTELPAPYGPWMEIAHDLPRLITSHRLRSHVHQMPQLSARHLRGREELHLAHLVLSFITMGYLWQEGEEGTVKVLPQNLAVPFWEVSQALGLPPILSHADFVLANWRRKNPNGNLDTIISLPGAESLRGFILVTLLVEKAAVPGIKVGGCCRALWVFAHLESALRHPRGVLDPHMLAYFVDPAVFYAVIRIFLSGWKDNPAMPGGLVYEGVSDEPLAYSGGSAAQSTVLHAFDELLGIRHTYFSLCWCLAAAFLHRMRHYMPPPHRAFVEEIHRAPSLRQHVLSSGDARLCAAFNRCVSALADFRSYHITIVTKYIAVAAAKAKAGRAEPGDGPAAGKPPSALEAKGTGGSHIFSFLKSVRDTTREGLIRA
uniref:Indoleamine 2,3-dioxygenase 2 n=1 Tax=Strix occidentalis caurina TaxID=311401 RepID=A0A8D0KWL6_STROC